MKEKELSLFRNLLQEALQWPQAKTLRGFIENVKATGLGHGPFPDSFTEWLEWATKKADWYDPLVKQSDELLDDADRSTLTLLKRPQN